MKIDFFPTSFFDRNEPTHRAKINSVGIFPSFFYSFTKFKRLDFSMPQPSVRSLLTAICLLCAFLCIFFSLLFVKTTLYSNNFLLLIGVVSCQCIFRLKHEMLVVASAAVIAAVEWVFIVTPYAL